jgi:DNA polymerase-3 subunit gamma/tau
VVETSDALRLHGLSAASTLEEMSAVLQRMAVVQAVPSMAASDDPESADIARLAALMPADETQLLYSMCLHGRAELGLAADEYAGLTMVLLRLLAFKPPAEKKTLNDAGEQGLRTVQPRVTEPQPGRVSPQLEEPRPGANAAPLQVPSAARAAVPLVDAPPGRVLRVVEARPGGAGGPVMPNGRPPSEVVGVPVRVPAESVRDAQPQSPPALSRTEEGDFWHATVSDLVTREAVTALVRELALQSQLIARDEGHWMLRVERESLNQPASRERLQAALKGAGHAVTLGVEVGAVVDSPARRNQAAAIARHKAAEEIILNDPFVQDMMRDFGARIVPGSIKPV